jgi:hypothetical protein
MDITAVLLLFPHWVESNLEKIAVPQGKLNYWLHFVVDMYINRHKQLST